MQEYFYQLADFIISHLTGEEQALCNFAAEDSDFVRLNNSAIRQAGTVAQRSIAVELVVGQRHAAGDISLCGDFAVDSQRARAVLDSLRAQLPYLPDDPHVLYATEVQSSEHHGENRLPEERGMIVDAILQAGQGRDLVGFYAAGGIHAGFANSFGQRNWFSTYTYSVDWSFYLSGDKAVKTADAGFVWNSHVFEHKVDTADQQLAALSMPAKTITPGRYRVYLAPSAVCEIMDLLNWGGFGLKEQQTKQTPLIKMTQDGAELHPAVTLIENTRDGVAPNFQEDGFRKPDQVHLITNGRRADCLVSPRSAKEYGVATNGASSWEAAESIDMAAGELTQDTLLTQLDTGIYINNLWYLNYSDLAACRMTGMTRFATFWVENGEIQAPLNVMRFDESLYRMLGTNLVGITAERDYMLDPNTYHARSTGSSRLPGLLVEDFTLTL